jgi:hypothetical protein
VGAGRRGCGFFVSDAVENELTRAASISPRPHKQACGSNPRWEMSDWRGR